jgi:hypothetical protein
VLLADIRLAAVCGNPKRPHAEVRCHPNVLDGADPRQQERRDLRPLHPQNDGLQVLLVRVEREAVGHRRAAEAVAVRHLDQRDAGLVEGRRDVDHLRERDAMALGVHAVAQAHVVEGHGHTRQVHRTISRAMPSAVRNAAAVMMSRLPAYFGR